MTDAATPSETSSSTAQGHLTGFGSKGYRTYVLGSLLLVYVFNFIDRTIINILTEPIKMSFGVEDWQMGLLGGPAFAILYTFLGIPIARLSERKSRVLIIAAAVAFWSLMTVLCGFATTFLILFLFRIGVSVGEAGCTPPAQSLIADYFKPSSRATAVSIYALGVPLGGMFASIFGGFVAGNLSGENIASTLSNWGWTWALNLIDWTQVEGWRVAFTVVGIPGLILGLLVWLTVKEPPRGYSDPPELQRQPGEQTSFLQVIRILLGKPTYVHVVLGATIASFIGYGVGQFTTSFLIRTHGLTIQQAALLFGIILGVMAAIGVFLSGYLSDKWAKRYPNSLSWLPAIGMSVSVPFYVLGYWADNLWIALPCLMVAALINYFYLGPMYAVSSGVVDSRMRATAVALTLFTVNLLGYGLGPPIIGALSTALKSVALSGIDASLTLDACRNLAALTEAAVASCRKADADGLQWSILIYSCLYLWAALHYLLAGKTLQRDMLNKPA